ncbi:hypothetical protein LXL04_022626 [Taraxacum kok-saghyz]
MFQMMQKTPIFGNLLTCLQDQRLKNLSQRHQHEKWKIFLLKWTTWTMSLFRCFLLMNFLAHHITESLIPFRSLISM